MTDTGGPFITWNLFLTAILVPVCVGILGYMVKKWFLDQKRGWDKYEEERVRGQAAWMARIEDTINKLVAAVKALEYQVFGKVNESVYKEDRKEIDLVLDEQGKKIITLEVTVKGLKGL